MTGRDNHDRNPDTPQTGLVCEGEHCIYHNPSKHHMDSWPIARGGERICPHGVGHPDPDYLAWRMRVTHGESAAGIHGCDGCCQPGPKQSEFVLDGSPEAVAIVREARGLPPLPPPGTRGNRP